MCRGKGTPGNKTTGNGNTGRSVKPRTLSLASLTRAIVHHGKTDKKNGLGDRSGIRSPRPLEQHLDEVGVHRRCLRTQRWETSGFKESARTFQVDAWA